METFERIIYWGYSKNNVNYSKNNFNFSEKRY